MRMPVDDGRLLITVILIILGLFFTIVNWVILINNVILKRKPASFIPFLGGILLYFGLGTVQQPLIKEYAYLALFIDLGCIPLVLMGSYFCIKKFLKK